MFLEQTLPKLRAPPSDFGGPFRGQELGVGAVVVLVDLEPGSSGNVCPKHVMSDELSLMRGGKESHKEMTRGRKRCIKHPLKKSVRI